MVRRTSAVFFATLACAGFAFAALASPSTRDATNVRENGKHDVQLDRAALFRPAQVAECGAVQRERVAPPKAQQRGRVPPPQKKSPANFGCSAVWTD
jgi:hypothetical protein